MFTEQQAIEIGNKVAIMCNLKMKNGNYVTAWGNKTALGIGRSIERVLDEVNAISYIEEILGENTNSI